MEKAHLTEKSPAKYLDFKTRQEYIVDNQGLVFKVANGYWNCGMSKEDLIQEGNVGLIFATDHFDPNRGVKFSSYACRCIQGFILTAMAKKSRMIRLPPKVMKQIKEMGRVEKALTDKLGRQPTRKELASRMKLKLEKLEELENYQRMGSTVSLNQAKNEDQSPLVDRIPDRQNNLEESLIEGDIRNKVQEALDRSPLEPREREIVAMSFGLGSTAEKEQNLGEIGKKFDLTRERIRQIREAAIETLKKSRDLEEIYREAA
jgi:RNA polymerase primary sigma factor